jgi:hypothetical protein
VGRSGFGRCWAGSPTLGVGLAAVLVAAGATAGCGSKTTRSPQAIGGDGGGTAADAAGGPAEGGQAGAQGAPAPSGVAIRIGGQGVEKIDLLFMIDNSISMADKQQILEAAVPELVNRLIDPICVDPETRAPTADRSSLDGCDAGQPEFAAVQDIHIGIITSSLGSHGGVLCSPEHQSGSESYFNPTQDDHGRLITRSRDGSTVPTYEGAGFLSWDPSGRAINPPPGDPGTADRAMLVADFQNLVTGAGEQGCGFEASLEAWYRFLVDPVPPAEVVRQTDDALGQDVTMPLGRDEILLEQRAQFLRPDSLVAIIMLSDENDCSVIDYGIGWFVGNTHEGTMPRSTSQCDANPNDLCCLSCIQAAWPAECSDPGEDPNCDPTLHDATGDRLNLRCYDQRRRFGLNFLYPTQRYVEALTSHEIEGYDGETYENPLFATNDYYPTLVPRMDSSLIFLVGIVGVPWQDLATDETLVDPSALEYLTAGEIHQRGFWELILGDPEASPPVPPADPFMIESVEPREGTNPRTRTAIAPPVEGAGGPAFNGHEYEIQGNNDLQYACIFQLETMKECADVEPGVGCDCKLSIDISMRPLCNGTTQTHAKAYPGRRFLKVLRDYGENSIVASICPKNPVGERNDPSYGYNPAMAAVVERVRGSLSYRCLAEPLPVDPDTGRMLCQVVEVSFPGQEAPCQRALPGREPLDEQTAQWARQHLAQQRLCGPGRAACDELALCLLTPAADGAERDACLNDLDPDVVEGGWCYLDRDALAEPLGNPELLADCPPAQPRRLRFVSPADAEVALPWPGSTVLVLCPDDVAER